MEDIYSNIDNPAGLSSIKKLYDEVKKIDNNVSIRKVKDFLASQDSYTLHRKNRNRFQRRKILIVSPGHTLMGDVAYMRMYEEENPPYLLVLLDGYSRYLTIFPIENLKATTVSIVLDNFFTNSIYKYKKFFTDEGSEFKNGVVKRVYRNHKIVWYTTFQKNIKVSPVERVILTIKNKLKRYITHFNSERYVDILNRIVDTYNITPHRGLLGRTPLDIHLLVKWEEIKAFSTCIYKPNEKKKSVLDGMCRQQVVRLQSARKKFSRSIHVQNTYELFKIIAVNKHHIPVTYKLSDLDGNPIKGIFYQDELTKVVDKGIYPIEIVKTRKIKGKTQYLVKYLHYPDSPKQWLSEEMLQKLT